MKNMSFCLLMGFSLCTSLYSLDSGRQESPNLEHPSNVPSTKKNLSNMQEKFDIMRRDEMDDTDTLAIPSDESEIEAEQQVDWGEKKDVFPLPSYKQEK